MGKEKLSRYSFRKLIMIQSEVNNSGNQTDLCSVILNSVRKFHLVNGMEPDLLSVIQRKKETCRYSPLFKHNT